MTPVVAFTLKPAGVALNAPALAPAPRASPVADDVLAAYVARRDAFAPFLERFGYGGELSA